MLPLPAIAEMAKLRSFLFLGLLSLQMLTGELMIFWAVEGVSINS